MRDVILRHRDPSHRMVITPEEARADLALALACREAASTGRPAEVRGADPSDVTSSL
jgi:hypothetical protein